MKYFYLVVTLLLSACSSVPLSTMMHFSDATPADFFQVDPSIIRIKVMVNSESSFDPLASIKLSATMEGELKQREYSFPLVLISRHKTPAIEGFFSNQPAFDVFILKLNAKAIKNLAIIDTERKRGIKQRVGLSAGIEFNKAINSLHENSVLSIGLKLNEQDDFIMLIDNWQLNSGM